MAGYVHFKSGSEEYILRVSGDNNSLCQFSSHFQVDSEDVLGGPSSAFEKHPEFIYILHQFPNEVEIFSKDYIVNAIQKFLKIIDSEGPLFQYRYGLKNKMIMNGFEAETYSSFRSGTFSIDGKHFNFNGGVGFCYMEEFVGDEKGKLIRVINRRDLREEKKAIETDRGPVKVTRKKLKITWPEILSPLVKFLEITDSDEIKVCVKEKRPSFTELLSYVQNGGGQDDWAGQEILKMGSKGESNLIEILKDSKKQTYHHTACFLLATLFPNPETKREVKDYINKLPSDKKTLFSALSPNE
jgi:hypothetical protein